MSGLPSRATDHPGHCRARPGIAFRFAQGMLVGLAALAEAGGAQAGDATAGRATWASICSTCHGADGVATYPNAPSFSRCERLNQDDNKLLASVRDGIGGRMPPWGGFLTEREILDAIAYARAFCNSPRERTNKP
jgi:mono/diheme cytochrome c family protein